MPGRQKTFAFQRREDPSEGKAGLFVGEKQESEGSHSWALGIQWRRRTWEKKRRKEARQVRQGKARLGPNQNEYLKAQDWTPCRPGFKS